jgi:hypothetical protein
MPTDTDVAPGYMDMSWDELVAKYGQQRASELNPTADPRYQELVKKYGASNAAVDYAQQVLDPETEQPEGELGKILDTESAIWANPAPQDTPVNSQIQSFIGGNITNPLEHTAENVGHAVGLGGPSTPAPAKKKTTTEAPTESTAITPNTAIESLFNDLAGQYGAEMKAMQPYISGQNVGTGVAAAQAIGQGIGGAAVQGMAPANEQMFQHDAAAVGAAESAGAKGIQGALKDEGTALGTYLGAAPYLGLLQALTSEAQYQTETAASTGLQSPALTKQKLPPGLEAAYQAVGQAGLGGGTTVPGTTKTAATTNAQSSPSSDNGDSPDSSG